MKKIKKIAIGLCLSIVCIFSVMSVNAASPDEAILSGGSENFEPLYTTSADSSLKEHHSIIVTEKDYQLFYTQTTLFALVAGYLILFKFKGIKNKEKMHRRKK